MRRLFDIFAGTSLLVCVAVCVVWFRSYRLCEAIEWRCERGSRCIRSAAGHLEVSLLVADWSQHPNEFHGPRYKRDGPRPPFNYLLFLCSSRGDTRASHEWGGFAWHELRNGGRGVLNAIGWAPFWGLAWVTGLSPGAWTLAWLRSRVRGRWKGPGFCRGCGYDLRATRERCPECGLEVKGMGAGGGIG
jgi:hypothetical protein